MMRSAVKVLPLQTSSRVFGVGLHDIATARQLRTVCTSFLDGDRPFRIYTPNPEILLLARHDPSYAAVLDGADLALPDGTGVAVLGSLRNRRRVRRWPGVEIGALLLQLAAERELTVAFVGGNAGAPERAAARWRAVHRGLRIRVVGDGVAVDDDGTVLPPARDDAVTRSVADAGATIVLVGLGAPKQERWIARMAAQLPDVRIMVGIGGAFDMWAGDLPRAPSTLHRLGLEWVWRLRLEPRRLTRIVRATIVFPLRALTDRSGR